jgi:hypothetical protein
MPEPTSPADPVTDLAQAAASVAEQFKVYVEAGIPAGFVAVMIGQMLGVMAVQAQPPGDG